MCNCTIRCNVVETSKFVHVENVGPGEPCYLSTASRKLSADGGMISIP